MYQAITGVGDGSSPVVNLTFPYLSRAHVKAEVDGVEVTFTWTGASQITFDANVSASVPWRVYRDSSLSAAMVDYTDGSVLTETDLDLANLQHQYLSQEISARVTVAQTTADGAAAAAADDAASAATSAASAAASQAAAALSETNAAQSATDAAASAAEVAATEADVAATMSGQTFVERQPGADAQDRMVAAFNAAPDGGTIYFPPGGVTEIASLVQIGNGPDVATGKNVRVVAHGHTFRFMADGARIELNGPMSAVLSLSANYTKGARTITVAHSGVQLADFVRNRWMKIVSDALDGWNRNQGTQANQYRLAEWAKIRKVVDNGDGTATITLWSPLKFTRGFTNTGDAENLTEGDTYTTANNSRVFVLLKDNLQWEGGTFEVDNAAAHIGVGGWSNSPLLQVMGYARPVLKDLRVGPGSGKGVALSGTPEFHVDGLLATALPDQSEQLANDGTSTSYLGYALAIAGSWGGVAEGLTVQDSRHGVTESNTTMLAGSTTYGVLMATGRTYGTRIVHPTVSGQYNAAVDTHHGAHGWVIENPVVLGTQYGAGLNLRGPDHTVIGGQINAERGVNVLSEFDGNGGSDLPGLVGNGDKWMSSARLIGVNFDVTLEAVNTQVAKVTLEAGGKIRSRTHNVFSFGAGVIEFASGQFDVEVTGEAKAATVNGDTTQRGIFNGYSVDTTTYGVTWTPGVTIREGARVSIDASAAVDTANMKLAGQPGATGGVISIRGALSANLPAAGMASAFSDSIGYELHRTASLDLVGNAVIATAHPAWHHGRVHLSNLAAGVAQKLLSVRDTLGGASAFYATVKVYLQDQATNVAPLLAEYTLTEAFASGATAEYSMLTSGSTTDFEDAANVDLTTTAPTSGKIAVGYKDGSVVIRHEKAGVTYEDVFADITIHRQPSLA